MTAPLSRPARAERQVMQALAAWEADHATAPTMRDIADEMGAALSTTAYRLQRLRAQGKVTWDVGKSRTLRRVRPSGPAG